MFKRLAVVLLCSALSALIAVAAPADAESEDADPDSSGASLDALRASDAELTAAIEKLDKDVASQKKSVQISRRALESAEQAVRSADDSLNKAEKDLDEAKEAAAEQVAAEYMRPRNGGASAALLTQDTSNVSDVGRRAGYMREIADRRSDALDKLRATKIDLDRNREAAVQAREVAKDRKESEEKRLEELNKTRKDKARLDKSLKERLAVYEAEDTSSLNAGSSGGRASRGGGGDSGVRASAAGMVWPVDSPSVSSPFGTRWGRLHAGIDLQAGVGTPLYAAKAGKVESAGWESGYGQYTCIDHGGGLSTCYAHQSRVSVQAGASVQAGQLIGYAGNTGASQAPHLHFETRQNGEPVNPMNFLP
jgi:murein DD-endopeptidase MepM/ murein hydrolase activator NlpD